MSELSLIRNPPVPEEIYTVDGNSYKYYASAEVSAPYYVLYGSNAVSATRIIGQVPISNINQIVKVQLSINIGRGSFYLYPSSGTGCFEGELNGSFLQKNVANPFYTMTYGSNSGYYAYMDFALLASGEISLTVRLSTSFINHVDFGSVSGNIIFWLL